MRVLVACRKRVWQHRSTAVGVVVVVARDDVVEQCEGVPTERGLLFKLSFRCFLSSTVRITRRTVASTLRLGFGGVPTMRRACSMGTSTSTTSRGLSSQSFRSSRSKAGPTLCMCSWTLTTHGKSVSQSGKHSLIHSLSERASAAVVNYSSSFKRRLLSHFVTLTL